MGETKRLGTYHLDLISVLQDQEGYSEADAMKRRLTVVEEQGAEINSSIVNML